MSNIFYNVTKRKIMKQKCNNRYDLRGFHMKYIKAAVSMPFCPACIFLVSFAGLDQRKHPMKCT